MLLPPNSVMLQNDMDKYLIAHHCYILVGRGVTNTPIEHHSYNVHV